mgnify:CR=1 FL=1
MKILQNLKKIHGLRSEIRTLARAYMDERTSMISKLTIARLALVYIISPIDIAPDIFPLIGITDDMIVIPLLMWFFIPNNILDDARRHIAILEKKDTHTHGWIFWMCMVILGLMLLYTMYELLT